MKILILSLLCVLFSFSLFCQEKVKPAFGNVSKQDFILPNSPVIDSNTNAVILADVGSTTFIGNDRHWFSYVFKKYERIKIINDKALNLSNVEIGLYGTDKDKDKLSDLKAVTYNLDGDKITTTELNKADVFEDKLNAFTTITKFALPSAKAGSIIEFSFTVTSFRFWDIPTWHFQSPGYPCLYNEFKAVFPSTLRYTTVRYGLDSFSRHETSEVKNDHYNMGDITATTNDIMSHWVMKDIAPLKKENFIYSQNDYLDKVEFVLAQTYNGEDIHDVGSSWEKVTNELLSESYFARAIDKEVAANLYNTAERETSGDNNPLEFVRHLYYYVRDNFTCIPDDQIYIGSDLYDVNKKKKGNIPELNLLLTALLRQKGIQAYPVILSTREYGTNPPDYPVLSKMNYVICMAQVGDDTILLDASRKDLGFGKLSIDCYNGYARVIAKDGGAIYLSPENIKEQQNTSVIIFNDTTGNLSGSFEKDLGFFGSEKLRDEIAASDKKKYFDKFRSEGTDDIEILDTRIDSLLIPDFPATIHVDLKIPATGDILYFSPVLFSEYNENPFKAEERKYPVSLPYSIDKIYTLNMAVPNGYGVDELPKPVKVSFNGNEGFFEYLIQQEKDRIQLRSHIKLNETLFPAEDYSSLRDFFAFILKKFNEQIVFKKKN